MNKSLTLTMVTCFILMGCSVHKHYQPSRSIPLESAKLTMDKNKIVVLEPTANVPAPVGLIGVITMLGIARELRKRIKAAERKS
jgi:hypothetical protein